MKDNQLPASQWQIFIDSLDKEQLLTLNEMACARIDYLNDRERSAAMLNFYPGDKVTFTDKKGEQQYARVVKINRKTVGVVNADGARWNVSPKLLSAVRDNKTQENVVPMTQPTPSQAIAPGIEDWVGSIVSAPGVVEQNGDFTLPKLIIFMDGMGFVRHAGVIEDIDDPTEIIKCFASAIASPLSGSPLTPRTVRTDNQTLIDLLQQSYPGINFSLGEASELDEVIQGMAEHFTDSDTTYSQMGISEPVVRGFFNAASLLYKIAPWKLIKSDRFLLRVSIPKYELRNAVVSVIGQQGIDNAVLLFDSLADYELFSIIASSEDQERINEFPPHRALTFEKGDATSPAARREIMENNWPVANTSAYPGVFIAAGPGFARNPQARDLHVFEALALGLTGLLKKKKQMKSVWSSSEPVEFIEKVAHSQGELEVTFQLPVLVDRKSTKNLNAIEKMAYLDYSEPKDKWESHQDLAREVSLAYENSKERSGLKAPWGVEVVLMDLSVRYMDTTIATILPPELEGVLYELIPAKVMGPASDAARIVADCRAFLSFLKRKYGLTNADMLIDVLGDDAEAELQFALSNSDNFSIGKQALSGGDLSMIDGAFDSEIFPMLDSGDFDFNDQLPGKAALTAEQRKKQKDKRKASRKARKKNKRK